MRVVIFTHSVESDWNHGNAHFLRGIASELLSRGNQVDLYEPEDGWSRCNLLESEGPYAIDDFRAAYPHLRGTLYKTSALDLDAILFGADIVLVHEWNPPELISSIGRHHRAHENYRLLFHDTHHRSLTDQHGIAGYDLSGYDGVLAYGEVIRKRYLDYGWTGSAWTWHEAADTRVFQPTSRSEMDGDLVWIGNWGDGERAESIREYLIEPVKQLGLKAHVYGVRYPDYAIRELSEAGIEYRGWLPNHLVPQVFGRYRMTVHIPRGPYVETLPGIPTIRVFEALACGIPLVSAPWHDVEQLFAPGDFLWASDGADMSAKLHTILTSPGYASQIARRGLQTIRDRHTCAHRITELLGIVSRLNQPELEMESV